MNIPSLNRSIDTIDTVLTVCKVGPALATSFLYPGKEWNYFWKHKIRRKHRTF